MSRDVRTVHSVGGLSLHGTTMPVRSSSKNKRPKSAGAVPQQRQSTSQQSGKSGNEPKQLGYAKPILRKMVQLARTSDVYGSFVQPTVAQSLDLIRRSIQQRSRDGAAFSSAFKRFRGDVRFLTLSSFRGTMIRMGIRIPEPHYEALFNLFDNDRSGTIDFEEFSYWVMQGTADPERAAAGEAEESDEMSESERLMLLEYVRTRLRKTNTIDGKTFADVMHGMTAGRPGLIARAFKLILSRMNVGITEREGLAIFNTIDEDRKGLVTVPEVIKWWDANVVVRRPNDDIPTSIDPTTFEEAVMRTTQSRLTLGLDVLHEAFEGYLRHSSRSTRLFYDEFRHTIRKLGIGKNERDMKSLFSFLVGSNDFVTVGELLRRTTTSYQLYNRPINAPDGSNGRNFTNKRRRLEREMREGLRLTYVKVKHALEAKDASKTGHLKLETVKTVLDTWCRPITYHDLRLLIQEVPRNEDDDVNYRELLLQLHPRRGVDQNNTESELELAGGEPRPQNDRSAAPQSLLLSRRRPRTAPSVRGPASPSLSFRTQILAASKRAEALRAASRQSRDSSLSQNDDTLQSALAQSPRHEKQFELLGLKPLSRAASASAEPFNVLPSNRSRKETSETTTADEQLDTSTPRGSSVSNRNCDTGRSYDQHMSELELSEVEDVMLVKAHKVSSTPVRNERPRSANGRLRLPSGRGSRPGTDSPITVRSGESVDVVRQRPSSATSRRSLSPRTGRRERAESHGTQVVDDSIFTKLQEKLKPRWKLVKIAFHELDSKQTGLVTPHDFQLILSIFDVFQMMSEQEFSWLSTRYGKGGHIWYVGFLRDLLQDVQHITQAKRPRPSSAKPPRSKFMLDSPRKPMRLRKSLLEAAEFLQDDLSVVGETDDDELQVDDDNQSVSSFCSVNSQSAEQSTSSFVARVAPFVVASWKDIRVKLKALQSTDYPGNVAAADLSGILYIFGVSLSAAEVSSLPRAFPLKVTVRSRSLPTKQHSIGLRLVDYNAFMRACFQSYRS